LRLPRDISGDRLIRLLERYGYEVVRQRGSHSQLVSRVSGADHHITVPRQRSIKVGLLGAIVSDVAEYLGRDRESFSEELFR